MQNEALLFTAACVHTSRGKGGKVSSAEHCILALPAPSFIEGLRRENLPEPSLPEKAAPSPRSLAQEP